MFQQDGTKPHTHHFWQEWREEHLPSFIDHDHWLPKSPNLNIFDNSWDEFAHQTNGKKVKKNKTEELKRAIREKSCWKVAEVGLEVHETTFFSETLNCFSGILDFPNEKKCCFRK